MHDAGLVTGAEAAIEIHHAGHKARREDADAAVIQQIDALRRAGLIHEHGVIAQMRIAMDDAIAAERQPPGGEHGLRQPVAFFQ